MNNLNSPAYPLINQEGASLEDREVFRGFSKIEAASLMIAQGLVTREMQGTFKDEHWADISARSVSIAKAVLEEANK